MQNPQVLAHLISQTRENIRLLASVNEISQGDADLILAKLPRTLGTSPGSSSTSSANPRETICKARAIWGYNEEGQETEDLTFFAGDIIEVIDDKDANWWTGRNGSKEGTFPATYVEKLVNQADRASRPVPPPVVRNFSKPPPGPPIPFQGPPQMYSAPMPPPQQYGYAPPPGPPQMYYAPPPPPGPYPPYGPPPQQQVIQEEPPKKKSGFLGGGLGNTLAHSAAGGVGFGAGSAAAGGIINSIF